MPALKTARTAFERLLELVVVVLMVGLAAIVVAGVLYRKFGASLVWYDEVASVMLAWLTYYGAALAALKGAHIGFPGLVNAAPPRLRLLLVLVGEAFVLGFFALLAWVGWEVLLVLEGDSLVSLPNVSLQLTQSVIPIGAVLFIIAELMRLPEVIRQSAGAGFGEKDHAPAAKVAEEPPAAPPVQVRTKPRRAQGGMP